MLRPIVFLFLAFSGFLCAETSPYVFQFEGRFEKLFQSGRYDLIGRIIDPDDVILEAGGFDGGDTIHLVKLVPNGEIISFEPNPTRYKELVTKTNGLVNVRTYPFALGEKNEMITFHLCHGVQNNPAFDGASSILPATSETKQNYQGPLIQVPCVRLDDWCRKNNQNRIDFIWLDLEGYELQVLKNSPQILCTVKAMYVETNFYEFRQGMTLYKDLLAFLEKNGFRLLAHGYYKGYQGNAIFVRADLFDKIVQSIESQP
jgi:FkbM family methyltransferase